VYKKRLATEILKVIIFKISVANISTIRYDRNEFSFENKEFL